MGRIADALKRSRTGIVSQPRDGSHVADAEEGLRFLSSDHARIVGPWRFDEASDSPPPASPTPIEVPSSPVMTSPPVAVDGLSLSRTSAVRATFDSPDSGRLVLNAGLADLAREQYRRLAATLEEVQAERGIKVVMITSARSGEGKTLTAANLALTLAESFNRQVALIEADLRRPSIHELFGLNGDSQSVGELAADGPMPLVQVRPRLALFAPDSRIADPIPALSSARMRQFLEAARSKFDWVVVDTPPAGLLPDAHVLASLVDAVVLVIAAGQTGYPAVQRACEAIGAHRVIGIVLNRAHRRDLNLTASGYAEYYGGEARES
jgi:protein-tyrosine kinase